MVFCALVLGVAPSAATGRENHTLGFQSMVFLPFCKFSEAHKGWRLV
jgi:hypothetical protein